MKFRGPDRPLKDGHPFIHLLRFSKWEKMGGASLPRLLPVCYVTGIVARQLENENAMARPWEIVAGTTPNAVYFLSESSAACAAPSTATRRPGAFAIAVSNSFSARPA